MDWIEERMVQIHFLVKKKKTDDVRACIALLRLSSGRTGDGSPGLGAGMKGPSTQTP